MRTTRFAWMALASLPLFGCFSLSVGTKSEPSQVKMSGLADGYAVIEPIPDYDGKILKLGLFSRSNRDGEWASIDLWPIGGVGVGFLGARVRILFIEIAAGVLGFPEEEPKAKPKKEEESPAPAESESG